MITQSPGNYREMTLVEDDHLRFQIVEDVRFDLIKSTEYSVCWLTSGRRWCDLVKSAHIVTISIQKDGN